MKDNALVVISDVFQEDDESSASELIVGKSMLENAVEATARHPPPCWARGAGQNSRRGWISATGVSRALVTMLLFLAAGWT